MTQEVRLQVLERDKYTCQKCYTKASKLNVHHIKAKRYGGTDSVDNLITYCVKCHKVVEPSKAMGQIINPLYRINKIVRIDMDVWRKARVLAAQKDITLSEVVVNAITKYVDEF